MVCPKCGSDTRVSDNVNNTATNDNYRQRTCFQCKNKFYTIESVVEHDDIKYKWRRHHRHSAYMNGLKEVKRDG